MATKKGSTKKSGAKKAGSKKAGAKKASGKKLSLGGILDAANPCYIKCIREFLKCVRQPGADREKCAIRLGKCIINCKS